MEKEVKLRDCCVKLFNTGESKSFIGLLELCGEVPFTEEHIEEIGKLPEVYGNSLPLYAFYDEDNNVWDADIVAPDGDGYVMELNAFSELILDNFDYYFSEKSLKMTKCICEILEKYFSNDSEDWKSTSTMDY